jgi:hypothetical protein
MTTHGAGPVRAAPEAADNPGACPVSGRAWPWPDRLPNPGIAGFTHFLRTPTQAETFKLDGADPRDDLPKLRTAMARLANAMTAGTDAVQDPASRENHGLPSGYTYLLQFIAHDLVQTSIPFWALDERSPAVQNDRTARLRLDALYGGGPNVCPAVFAPDDPSDTTRTKLRVGPVGLDPGGDAAQKRPLRDLVRVGVASDNAIAAGPQRLADPLIADPRNDDHAIISQLTTLFHQFHNAVIDEIWRPKPATATVALTEAQRRYACAREAVTLVYREIIRRDVMPRLLHQSVRDLIDTAGSAAIAAIGRSRSGEAGMPLEFSHGAFRFGHAMVRQHYKIGDHSFDLDQVLNQNSHLLPRSMPLVPKWIVHWSNFFVIDGSTPNFSLKLSPTFSDGLLDDRSFGEIDATATSGLAYRDLMSAALAGLWSVDSLIEALRAAFPELIDGTPILADKQHRADLLHDWFSRHNLGDAAAALAQDPPLLFFVLFEAENDSISAGTTLGVLGSLIVASVIYLALDGDPLPTETAAAGLPGRLQALTQRLYGDNRLDAINGITSMAALVKYVAPGQQTPPAFI